MFICLPDRYKHSYRSNHVGPASILTSDSSWSLFWRELLPVWVQLWWECQSLWAGGKEGSRCDTLFLKFQSSNLSLSSFSLWLHEASLTSVPSRLTQLSILSTCFCCQSFHSRSCSVSFLSLSFLKLFFVLGIELGSLGLQAGHRTAELNPWPYSVSFQHALFIYKFYLAGVNFC